MSGCETPQRCFLEASAGTGKTFTIEQLIIKHLVADPSLKMSEILVVTFTNLATLELKMRIQKRLLLEKDKWGQPLTRALYHFDKAAIYTIHSFCFHALTHTLAKDDPATIYWQQDLEPDENEVRNLIKDYLRVHFSHERTHPEQLLKVLKSCGHSIENLTDEILKLVEKRVPISGVRHFLEIIGSINKVISELKEKYHIAAQDLYDDLLRYSPCFEKMCDRQKNVKEEVRESLQRFCSYFDTCEKESFPFETQLVNMTLSHQLKSAKWPERAHLHYVPELFKEIQERLIPLFIEMGDEMKILGRLAEDVRVFLDEELLTRGPLFYQDYIQLMAKKCEESEFCNAVRGQYKVVLVDEFQDTDAFQWKIFSTLFFDPLYVGSLYLIGDPKQSIYRFRQADLYTYYKAKEGFASHQIESLQVGYRADPSLQEALNALFTPIKDFLNLPKTGKNYPCPPLEAGQKVNRMWKDDKKSVHFIKAESEEKLFLLITEEVKRLYKDEGISPQRCALLVKDRFQAQRFSVVAQRMSLPCVTKRSRSLLESKAWPALEELLLYLALPTVENERMISQGPLAGFDVHIFNERGLVAGVKQLPQRFGGDFVSDLLQLAEMCEGRSPESALIFLSNLKLESAQEVLMARQVTQADAFQILTIHMSKGLEYDIVFPVGLILESQVTKEFIFDEKRNVLSDDSHLLDEHIQELEAEKMRLLYVAMTRAKKRLYMPVLPKHEKSPMSLFLEKWLQGKSLESHVQAYPCLSISK